jgi:outer membrane protein OmpA-like peptidoglycan-associated protein
MRVVTRAAIGLGVILTLALLLGCVPKAPEPKFIRYDYAKDTPKDDDDTVTVGSAVGVLQREDRLQAIVVGYASSDGDASRNKDLSLRRARRVRDMMLKQGIAPARLKVGARGADDPIASNDTEDGRAKNRRVEVFFYYPDRGDAQSQYHVKIEIHAE